MMDIIGWMELIDFNTSKEDYPLEYTYSEGGNWYLPAQRDNLRIAHAVKFSSGKVIDRINGVRKAVMGSESNTITYGELSDEYIDKIVEKHKPRYKYNEEALIKEFSEYIANTYQGHYVGEKGIQSLDLIFAAKAGWGFCQGNVLKYAGPRLGIKNEGKETRADILKVLHYSLLMLYLLDKKEKNNG